MSVLDNLPLGKTVTYESIYNKMLLQGVPRALKREPLGISENHLPFQGEDLWNLYEMSWLNPKGKPVIATAEVRFAIDSKNLVESKSFKLYLNSFNQTRFQSEEDVITTMVKDLSEVVQGNVSVYLHPENLRTIKELESICIDDEDISMDNYNLQPGYLKDAVSSGMIVSESLCSHLLKSNCLVTGQPDWASLQIDYTGPKIDKAGLLKYLVSFRQHNEFHEQCVERIFTDIKHYCKTEQLTVFARYTRRGGLDINPLRSDNIQAGNIRFINNKRLMRQ